jgi:hypothetical protein
MSRPAVIDAVRLLGHRQMLSLLHKLGGRPRARQGVRRSRFSPVSPPSYLGSAAHLVGVAQVLEARHAHVLNTMHR